MIPALRLLAEREIALTECAPPPPPGPGEVQLRIRTVALNHIDVWGYRGMAFAKRQFPLTVGAEAAGEIAAVGPDVTGLRAGQWVVPYSALTCGVCRFCRKGQDNLCEDVGGVRGFHVDGFAQALVNHPARLVVAVPDGVDPAHAACVPVAYATVEHMLFDNAALEPGETISSMPAARASAPSRSASPSRLAAPSSPPSAATPRWSGRAHSAPITSSTTAPTVSRAWCASLLASAAWMWCSSMSARRRGTARCCLCGGAALVTCGATSGPSGNLNLMQLFQQQYRIVGSFGAPLHSVRNALDRIASGVLPVIDTRYDLGDFRLGLDRLAGRDVFGKILVTL